MQLTKFERWSLIGIMRNTKIAGAGEATDVADAIISLQSGIAWEKNLDPDEFEEDSSVDLKAKCQVLCAKKLDEVFSKGDLTGADAMRYLPLLNRLKEKDDA